ncbi:hypothetical protein EC565_05320 [Helicobacter pylori]|nr:hypothetical protein EC565_05320 [Helicobacter pylori]
MKKESSAQNPQFSNNTLTIIEKLNNGVKISSNLDSRSKNFYSDRNFIDFKDARPLPSTLNEEILSQKDLAGQEDY